MSDYSHVSAPGTGALRMLRFAFTLLLLPPTATAFNNDGHTHILWQHRARGETGIWIMKRAEFTTAAWITNDLGHPWQLAATADFNRDNHPDLFWRNSQSGENSIWLMERTNRVARLSVPSYPTNFVTIGSGDFNADGFADVVWQDAHLPRNAVWFLTNTNWTGQLGWLPTMEHPDWAIAATADFNNDNHCDLILRNRRTGANRVWFMSGTNRVRAAELPPQPDLGFQLAAVGAFNSVSQPDLFWRHTNGANLIWRLHGTELLGTVTLPTETDTNWVAIGTGGYTNFPLVSAITLPSNQNALLLSRSFGSADRAPVVERKSFLTGTSTAIQTGPRSVQLTQSGLRPGELYEFTLGDQRLVGGIRVPAVEQRGKVILVVEKSAGSKLERELNQFRMDLIGDGWTVIRTNVARHNDRNSKANAPAIAAIKKIISHIYSADPKGTKAVILFGRVPIPYSGFHSPDGHGGRALAADSYYGDVDGLYTDFKLDFDPFIDGPREARHENRPGDGKWDQNTIPRNERGEAELELAVGRIDFAKLPACLPNREVDLLRQYLVKNHRYRHKQLVFAERTVAGSFFYYGPNPFLYGHAMRHSSRWFGSDPRHVLEGDLFTRTNGALWGFQGGWGLPTGIQRPAGGYHTSEELGRSVVETKTAFCSLFGSYLLDWDYTNSLLRATLALPNAGLGAMWFNPMPATELSFESLALGEPIATGLLRSINEKADSAKPTYYSFLGDPTLRLHLIAPPSNFTVRGNKELLLDWSPSPEANHYFVYRSTKSADGPWQRLTPAPIAATQCVDSSPPSGPKLYQVRAVKLTTTGSGSFTNLSQAVFNR